MKDNPALDQELKQLLAAVKQADNARKQWMDAHMADYADYQVGETLYDRDTGECVGVVSGFYRYHEKDPRFDTCMSVEYRFSNGDNTSRYGTYTPYQFVNAKKLARIYEEKAKDLALRVQA